MELRDALETLKLQDLSEDWVTAVWDSEFTELVPLDAAVEEAVSRDGGQGLQDVFSCLQRHTEDRQPGASQSVWSLLGDSGVSTRSVLALLAYLVVRVKGGVEGLKPRLLSLHAASLYLLLLATPGSVVNQVFQQVLFDACVALPAVCRPQGSERKRKKDGGKSSQTEGKRTKTHRRQQEEVEDEEEEEEEMVHFSTQDLFIIRENIVLLVKNLLRLLQVFPLKDKPQSADSCVKIFTQLTDFEPVIGELEFNGRKDLDQMRTVPELAYHGLELLCSPSHGDQKESVRGVFHSLLYVILMMSRGEGCKPSLLLPSRAVVTSRDQALLFVCHLVDQLKDTALPLLRILLQQLCCKMVEKTDYRCHGAQAVSKLLDKMPSSHYAAFIKWLFAYSTNSKVVYRLFALDVAVALLESPERQEDSLDPEQAGMLTHRFLVQSLVFGRRSDSSPTVRGHALTCLARCLEMPSLNATRSVQELFSSTGTHTGLEAEATDGSLRSQRTYRTLPFKTVNITNSDTVSYESNAAMSLLKKRVSDQKIIVRKSAMQAMMSLLKHSVILLSQENLSVLSERCRDPALSVKKKALQCLGELLKAQPHSREVQRAWLRGLLPALLDPESSVQERALEGLDQVLLSQVKRPSSRQEDAAQVLCWDLLELLCHDCQDVSRYLSKAITVWSKQNRFTAAFIKDLLSHTEECEHAAGAWLLLAKVTGSSPKFDYSRILEAWDNMVRLRNVSVSTSCHILGVLGDVCEHLNLNTRSRIVDDIMSWLRSLQMPLEVMGACVETLCRLGRSQTMTDPQKFLNQHCGELVSLCETYLSTVILNEKGAQNLDEDLVVKHLYLLGVASLHCPVCVTKRTILLVQSVLSSSPEHTAEEVLEEPPASHPPASQPPASQPLTYQPPASQPLTSQPLTSQPLSQFSPSSLPSRVRAQAVLTLGKLCLQHEELTRRYLPAFAGELQLSADMAVRSNVVVVLCDLCVRYTNMVETYIPCISACLQDKHALVREQTVIMVTSLLQEEYVKWKGSLFFRFVTVLVDPEPAVSRLCEFCLVHLLLKKNPAMFSQHFIECIFHFNSYEKHKTYNKFPQTASEKARFSLKGSHNRDKRFRIYRFLLGSCTDAQRFNITTKISLSVLACFVDGELSLDSEGSDVLSETLSVLSLKEMKLQALSSGRAEAEEQEEEQMATAKAVIQVAQRNMVSQVQKKIFIENVIPIIIALKSRLEQQRSPVLKDLMGYLQVTMQDYRSKVKELFAADEQLAAELEFNLKLGDKEQQENMAASHMASTHSAASTAASPCPQAPTPATPSRRLLQGGVTVPQAPRTPLTPLPAQLSRLLPQSARRPSLRAANPPSSYPGGSLPAQDSVSAPPKGNLCYRAISTPHGNINDVTFGEGVSAIFSERRTGASDQEDNGILFLPSPEKGRPPPRQWAVQSPLATRRTRRTRREQDPV